MSTRLIIIRDSVPLAGRTVRVTGVDGEFVTDADGMVDLGVRLEDATELHVADGERWITRHLQPRDSASLIVVEIGRTSVLRAFDDTLDLGERYELKQVIGRGGMGVVVEAIDRMLERRVAVKMLSAEFRENEEARDIFLAESRSLARLAHANLVAVHDVAVVKENVLMVLEFVEGQNVERVIKHTGPFPQIEAVRCGIQLARAIEYLHTEGIIHRDIKPGNLMLQPDGTVKLIDFGLARSLEELYARGTRVRGSPAYMAPEQIEDGELTVATDMYQIGVTLFEMIAGELPFRGGSMTYAHVHTAPPNLEERTPGIDTRLAEVVARCLAKDPAARPSSSKLLAELQAIHARLTSEEPDDTVRFAAQSPVSVEPTPTPASTSDVLGEPSNGQTKKIVALVLVLGVVATAIAVGFRDRETSKPVSEATSELAAAGIASAPGQADETLPLVKPDGAMPPVGSVVPTAEGLVAESLDDARRTLNDTEPVEKALPTPAPAEVAPRKSTTAPRSAQQASEPPKPSSEPSRDTDEVGTEPGQVPSEEAAEALVEELVPPPVVAAPPQPVAAPAPVETEREPEEEAKPEVVKRAKKKAAPAKRAAEPEPKPKETVPVPMGF